MYVVMNEHFVPTEDKAKKASRYVNSPEKMKDVPGCLEFMFLHGENDGKQIVYTKWESKEDYIAWFESENYNATHTERVKNKVNDPNVRHEHHRYEVLHNYLKEKELE